MKKCVLVVAVMTAMLIATETTCPAFFAGDTNRRYHHRTIQDQDQQIKPYSRTESEKEVLQKEMTRFYEEEEYYKKNPPPFYLMPFTYFALALVLSILIPFLWFMPSNRDPKNVRTGTHRVP